MLKIEHIKIGDEVLFHSTKFQSNNDLYWVVVNIYDEVIIVENPLNKSEKHSIRIEEIKYHTPKPKKL